jgi:hypothetical protein
MIATTHLGLKSRDRVFFASPGKRPSRVCGISNLRKDATLDASERQTFTAASSGYQMATLHSAPRYSLTERRAVADD